ncbi:orotidine-5'-phosphate decarboxylase [Candidatus Thiodictyon syntrophicum]|jgi:orotidine-5'-phosphate decarboxylase|uniref:Orotidine 5'-phosphate decarboxylase n=1 Tax=Candidatus Thiodictyon syntrophicum TaxID=1166950 RepID=A0A2K8UCS0_9GAMM|nr:orotidine-5'-phosphate decarboxylase [Candidatus Thiodictyon syntrophicum]AUB83335.1 orotidine 5'-phosphate decarboxylase [Candidatus Thiodictyon syntrophicum]
MTDPKPIIVALDVAAKAPALALVERLDPTRCRLKVGNELFTRLGPSIVRTLHKRGFEVFLDLKFHDIPNTVAAACAAAADLGVWMLNVHCTGGAAMIAAARARLDQVGGARRPVPRLIGVTVLTSLDADDLAAVGCPGEPRERVLRLAELGRRAGLDGVVCSPQEAALVRRALGPGFLLVTPGVRPAGAAVGDQKRVMTPAQAIAAGADYLVIGRPITGAPDPAAALAAIEQELTVAPA